MSEQSMPASSPQHAVPSRPTGPLRQLLDVMHGRTRLSAEKYIALVAEVRITAQEQGVLLDKDVQLPLK